MKRKLFNIILISVMAGVLLTGCGSNGEKKESESSNVESTLTDNENDDESSDQPSQNVEADNTEQNEDTTQKTDSDQPNKSEDAATTEKADTTEKNEQTTEKDSSNKGENEKPSGEKTPSDDSQAAHKHNYSSKVTKEATCTSKGVKTYSCDCGDSYTEEIKETAHNEGNWTVTKAATCKSTGTKIKTCTTCGVELNSAIIAKTGHTASGWTTTKAATCQSTGTKVKNCTVCNAQLETATIAKSSNHTYAWTHVSNGDYKVNVCSGCGAESGTRAYNLGNGIYGYYDDDAAAELFECVNTERNSAHTVIRDEVTLEVIDVVLIPSLIWRDEDIAKKRALDIVTKFSHDGYLTDNENLAKGQGTAVDVHCDWCFSSTHAQTLLSIDYVYGSTACLWVDSDGKGTMYPYWTLVLSIQ